MATERRSMRRRTLRSTSTLDPVEGSLTRSDSSDRVVVEIAGGPPRTTATLRIGGIECHRVRLDGCGAGSAQVTVARPHPFVEILVDDRVLLTGRLPEPPAAP